MFGDHDNKKEPGKKQKRNSEKGKKGSQKSTVPLKPREE